MRGSEKHVAPGATGRPAGGGRAIVPSSAAARVGIDVGGQSLKAALVDDRGHVLSDTARPTGPRTGMVELADLCADAIAELGDQGASALGVGVAGCVTLTGVVSGSPNLPLLSGVALARRLSEALARDVTVDNDAHCHALAEGWIGAAAGEPAFLLLTLGSGIGSGLVIDGRVYRGTTGFGCEFGHMVFRPRGRLCACGNRGCIEAYLSEVALRGRIAEEAEALAVRVTDLVAARSIGHAHALFDLADQGDEEASAFAAKLAGELGTALASVINLLDLESIVLGGGIAPSLIARGDVLRRAMAESLFARKEAAVRIEPAAAGVLAGAVGAARMAMLAV